MNIRDTEACLFYHGIFKNDEQVTFTSDYTAQFLCFHQNIRRIPERC